MDETFANPEHLEGLTDADAGGNAPHLSPDEKTIYFHGLHAETDGIWVSHWIDECDYLIAGDLNDDCKVNLADVALMVANWLKDCEQTPDDSDCIPK